MQCQTFNISSQQQNTALMYPANILIGTKHTQISVTYSGEIYFVVDNNGDNLWCPAECILQVLGQVVSIFEDTTESYIHS